MYGSKYEGSLELKPSIDIGGSSPADNVKRREPNHS